MDDYFRKAEQRLSDATSIIEIRRVVSGLFLDLFKERPATVAHMVKVMVQALARGKEFEGKRQMARILIRSLQSELSKPR